MSNRRKLTNGKKLASIAQAAVEKNVEKIKEFLDNPNPEAGFNSTPMTDAYDLFISKYNTAPTKSVKRTLFAMIANLADVKERPEPTSFSEERASENRPSSITKKRRTVYSVKKYRFEATMGNKVPTGDGKRYPRKFKKQVKKLLKLQYEKVMY
jgi:hypothetical protein